MYKGLGHACDNGYSTRDGKILVTCSSNYGWQNDFAVVRYNSDRTLDNTFSGDGIVSTAVGGTDHYPSVCK